MIPVNIEKISRNYEVDSLQEFCQKWLMPCVDIKQAELEDL